MANFDTFFDSWGQEVRMGNRSGYKGLSKTVEKLTSPKLSKGFWF